MRLDVAAEACDEAEAPEVEAEAQQLVTQAFRARGSIDEMVLRLDLAGGDFLGDVTAVEFPPDPAYAHKVPPGDPQPKQPPDPTPDPQPQPQQPPPPPPSDLVERLAGMRQVVTGLEGVVGRLQDDVDELPEWTPAPWRRRVEGGLAMLEESARLTGEWVDGVIAAAGQEAAIEAGTLERCEVCGDVLTPGLMADHLENRPPSCRPAAQLAGEACWYCGGSDGELVITEWPEAPAGATPVAHEDCERRVIDHGGEGPIESGRRKAAEPVTVGFLDRLVAALRARRGSL